MRSAASGYVRRTQCTCSGARAITSAALPHLRGRSPAGCGGAALEPDGTRAPPSCASSSAGPPTTSVPAVETCQSGRCAASAAPAITERAALPVQRKTMRPAHGTRRRARIGRWSEPTSGSTSLAHHLDARGDEEVVDLVAGAGGRATSCPGRPAATRWAPCAAIVQPHMFMSPTNTAGRSAGAGRDAAHGAWSGEPNSRWLKCVATTVRFVPSTSSSAWRRARVDGSVRSGGSSITGWCGSACARAGPGTSRRRRPPLRVGPARQLGLRLERRARHRDGHHLHPQGGGDLVVLRGSAVGRPRLLQHQHVGLERLGTASARSNGG